MIKYHCQIPLLAKKSDCLVVPAALYNWCVYLVWIPSVCISCSIMSDSLQPHGYSPTGSSIHGILQVRILEWVAIPFCKGSFWLRDWTQVFCIAGRFVMVWATRKAHIPSYPLILGSPSSNSDILHSHTWSTKENNYLKHGGAPSVL